MPKKKTSGDETWGPFYDTYNKNGKDGFVYEQEVPSYREVNTPHGTFGVQPGFVLSFEDKTILDGDQEVVIQVAVFEKKKGVKSKPPKKTDRRVEV